jgi:hypothetical protein
MKILVILLQILKNGDDWFVFFFEASFYIAAPLSLCGDCALDVFDLLTNLVTEFIVKGKNQMPIPEIEFWLLLNPLTRLGWKHWIGAAVFSWGWIHQYRCHKILVCIIYFTWLRYKSLFCKTWMSNYFDHVLVTSNFYLISSSRILHAIYFRLSLTEIITYNTY